MSQAHQGCNPNVMTKLAEHSASSWRREHSPCFGTSFATIWACHDPSEHDATDATRRTRDVLTIDSIDHTDAGPDDGDRLGVYLVVCDVGQDRLGGCLVILVTAAPLVVTSVVGATAVLWLGSFDYDHSHGTVASY